MPCSRAIMRNVSFEHIEYVDAWSRTTQYGDDRPVHPEALPESYVDVGRWRDYRSGLLPYPASASNSSGDSLFRFGGCECNFLRSVVNTDGCTSWQRNRLATTRGRHRFSEHVLLFLCAGM